MQHAVGNEFQFNYRKMYMFKSDQPGTLAERRLTISAFHTNGQRPEQRAIEAMRRGRIMDPREAARPSRPNFEWRILIEGRYLGKIEFVHGHQQPFVLKGFLGQPRATTLMEAVKLHFKLRSIPGEIHEIPPLARSTPRL